MKSENVKQHYYGIDGIRTVCCNKYSLNAHWG